MNVSPNGITSPVEEPALFARYSQQVHPWNNRRNDLSEFLDDTDSSGDDPDKRFARLCVATTSSLCSFAGLASLFCFAPPCF
jgi:hypothetical protein